MRKSSVISFRADEDMLAMLDRLAEAHDRSRAWVVNRLLQDAARQELRLLDDIDEGIAAIEAGDFYTQEQLMEQVEAHRTSRRAA